MSRLIFVPQYPTKLRYQSWWFTEFPKQFRKRFDNVLVLGEYYLKKTRNSRGHESMFSPIDLSINFETQQIKEYMNIKIQSNDILFLADISFPGFFAGALYHKPCPKMYAFCHAGAKNAYDYWQPVRKYKWKLECAHAMLFDKIFVGTYYHWKKLDWRNTVVTRLPDPPLYGFPNMEKNARLISVCRPSIQKVNKKLEKYIEKEFGRIHRTVDYEIETWEDYYTLVSQSKVMIITSREECYGYNVIDAVLNNCIPVAPYKFSYPELLPSDYLYRDPQDLKEILHAALDPPARLHTPQIKCQHEIDNFYEKICGIMKGE